MTTTAFALFILLTVLIYLIGVGILNHVEIKRLREIRCKQKTQTDFGRLRQRLVMLVAEKNIDTHSIMFLELYKLNTTIMRRPDNYKLFAKELHKNFLKPKENGRRAMIDELGLEKKTWSKEFKDVILDESECLFHLMIEHSPWIRVARTLINGLRRVIFRAFKREFLKKTGTIEKMVRSNETNNTFMEVRDELVELAA